MFKSFSKYPPCYKDITFWLPDEKFNENDFHEVASSIVSWGFSGKSGTD
jgi:phenylalanyl-tRNA synthetase alpha chain